ncbi:MAG: RNA polymerase sigma-54 factor [Candidatus Schekmanbacteria bacterium RBG_13_48_7]|uniref:RNA polymerase sigma-54 factor n=1 Tax=Candidatus Schekmanbacteria bacterium RBG_13_48_7 TaxID=1817878 RepID=A0A1F7RVI3_9BACT|nr:MAG: RNA polymerase sigma-54 factor [Candidatus Schekmanbacteria bacterium RBG_13_48_7]
MAMETRLDLKLAQKLVMTPNLQMAIKLLQLSKLELKEKIETELLENPLLEEIPPETTTVELTNTVDDISAREHPAPEPEIQNAIEDMEWDNYFQDGYESDPADKEMSNAYLYENMIRTKPTLADHLLWQLTVSAASQADNYEIGKYIIGNIDENGYLRSSIEEISKQCGYSDKEVEQTLGIIQKFDPIGVGARNLTECLRIQLDLYHPNETLAKKLVEKLSMLQKRRYSELAKEFDTTVEEIKSAQDIIVNLEPKPGRAYSVEEEHYVIPDVYVIKVDNDYRIVLNEDGLPRLRINHAYRSIIEKGKNPSEKDKEFVENKLNAALWLIKSVDQRRRTIFKVSESIVKFQKEFFDKGIGYLRPLILRDVAEDIGMHESTVSRVSTNKYMHTPQGVLEIKFFFHSGLSSSSGEDISSIRVREMIKKILSEEDSKKPLSDKVVAEMLKRRGLKIARRTVAKYREDLKIPSSNLRKIS